MKPLFAIAVVDILGAVTLGSLRLTSVASPFEARTSDAAGVSIVVTPRALAAGSAVWEFDIAMNTHVRPLADDLTAAAVLVEGNQRVKPVSWQGDPPGGHHRKGVLRFPAPSAPPPTFDLQMSGVGGTELRTFHWGSNP